MRIRPFAAVRPPPELAPRVASLPYDVGDLETARAEARANAMSFLHVERPEVDLPDAFDAASRDSSPDRGPQPAAFPAAGHLQQDAAPALYVYQQVLGRAPPDRGAGHLPCG
jgi:uncharacterized protein (DUF1015 family)